MPTMRDEVLQEQSQAIVDEKVSGGDCAYAAGLFDGEGCVAICRSKPDHKHSTNRFYLKLVICMCDRVALLWLHKKFGGILRERKWLSKHKPEQKRQWSWQLGGGPRVVRFLEQLMPWLKVKKPQAELALVFQSTVFPKGGDTRGAKRMTAEKEAMQFAMYWKMRALKKEEVL